MGVRTVVSLIKIEIINAMRDKVFFLLTLILPFIITSIIVFGLISNYEPEKSNNNIKEVKIGFTNNIDNDITYICDAINSEYHISIIKTDNYIKDLKDNKITVYIHLWEISGEKNIRLYADTSIKEHSLIVDSIKAGIYKYYDINGEQIKYEFVQQSTDSGYINTDVKKVIMAILIVVTGYIALQIILLAFYINSKILSNKSDNMKIALEAMPVDRMGLGVLKYLSSISVLLISLGINIVGIVLGGLIAYFRNPIGVRELLRLMFLEQGIANIIVMIVGIIITVIIYGASIIGNGMYIRAIKRWFNGKLNILKIILIMISLIAIVVETIFVLLVVISIFNFDQFVLILLVSQLTILSTGLIFTCIAIKLLSSEKLLIGIDKHIPLTKRRLGIKKGGLPNIFYTILAFSIFESICLFVSMPYIYQILAIIIPLGFTIYFKYDIKQTFSLKIPRFIHIIGGLCILVVFIVVGDVLSQIMFIIFPTSQVAQSAVKLMMQSTGSVIGALLLVAILPGVSEEMLFRGFMLSGFRATKDGKKESGKKAIIVVIIIGIIFGAIHMEFRLIPTLSLMGIVFGYCTYKSESIYIGMMMHIINNAYATLSIITPNNVIIKRIDTLTNSLAENILVGTILLVVIGIIGFKFINVPIKNKFNKRNKDEIIDNMETK